MRHWRLVLGMALLVTVGITSTGLVSAEAQPMALTQMQALTMALQQNPQLRVAAFEVLVARAQLAQARAGTALQASVQGSYTRTQDGVVTTIPVFSPGGGPPQVGTLTIPAPSSNIYDARLVLQYPLSSGGRIEAQVAMAEANLRGAEATFERIKQQIVFGVRQAYFSLLLAQASLRAADHSVTQADETLRVARARVATGVSPRFDQVQAEVAVATAKQIQVRARNSVAQAMQGLNALLNMSLETPLILPDPFAMISVATPTDRLLARALEVRAEVAEVRARQAAAQAAIEVAESGGRLNFGLSGMYDYGNSGPFGPGADLSSKWSVTLAATIAVSDGGLTRERVSEARQRLEQLKALEAQQRQTVELDVRQASLNLQSAREELVGAGALVEQAAEALRLANVRFAAGVGTNLEVVSAQAASS
ncbi:MAG TPA: TolC family protein [bacterium]|nr:TolC family protein [bacterium]